MVEPGFFGRLIRAIEIGQQTQVKSDSVVVAAVATKSTHDRWTALLCLSSAVAASIHIHKLYHYRKAHRRFRRCLENHPSSRWHVCRGPLIDASTSGQDVTSSSFSNRQTAGEPQSQETGTSFRPVVCTLQVWGATPHGTNAKHTQHTSVSFSETQPPLADMSLLASMSLPKQIRLVRIGTTLLQLYPPFVEFCVAPEIRTSQKQILIDAFQEHHEVIPRELDRYHNPWRPLQVLMWAGGPNTNVTAIYVNECRVRSFRPTTDVDEEDEDQECGALEASLSAPLTPHDHLIITDQHSGFVRAPQVDLSQSALLPSSCFPSEHGLQRIEDSGIWLLGTEDHVQHRLRTYYGCASWKRIATVTVGLTISCAAFVAAIAIIRCRK